ncbi:acyl-CoA synthetase, putative [Plasmodium sp. gorilla clade G2]|uniref:acyl-CoA synthetase, putative n=1 Tax=Plasmodium sp. gorilla clade G2 TaxID=880535 RepID=UPI000D2CC4C6|nr:acyl-CoA synthetase, putative [Plasmodium sp. gorilla clade G2]SOV20399.1 acyl-CoA synthetase, putative [Plasmodium sp. gorilla clade G2]
MVVVFNISVFVIYLIYIKPNFSQFTSEYEVYSEICENSANENESCVYCMKDHKRKSSKYVYKHIMKMFFENNSLNKNKIALIEHE